MMMVTNVEARRGVVLDTMGGVRSAAAAISAAATAYQSAAQDAGIALASDEPALGKALTTQSAQAMELLAKLAPPEPHLGSNIDMRV